MAPALTETAPAAPHELSAYNSAPRDIFPDGLKTTGQHPPLYEEIQPFEQFPKEITGRTLWHPDDYRNNPEKWTHRFTPEEVEELSTASDNFLKNKIPLTGISKVSTVFKRTATLGGDANYVEKLPSPEPVGTTGRPPRRPVERQRVHSV